MVPNVVLCFFVFCGSIGAEEIVATLNGRVVAFSEAELDLAKNCKDQVRGAMTINETAMLIRYISSADSYFEFGSGGSTQIACMVGKPTLKIWTVDSSASFLQGVMARPCLKDISTERIHVIAADIGPTKAWGYPSDEKHRQKWASYSLATGNVNAKLDVILIDGRFRIACAVQAMLKHPESKILVHNFFSNYVQHKGYKMLLNISQIVEVTETLTWIKRKADITDAVLKQWWLSYYTIVM